MTGFDADTFAVTMTAPIPGTLELQYGGGVYVTPDGRFIVWRGRAGSQDPWRLGLFDVVTRQTMTLSVAEVPTGTLPSRLFGHPSRPEVYTAAAGDALVLTPAGQRVLACPGCGGSPMAVSFSGDGSRVAYQYGFSSVTVVFDTESGATISTVTHPVGPVALSLTGRELYVASGLTLYRYATQTGALLQQLTLTGSVMGLHVDPGSGRLLVDSGQRLAAFEGDPMMEVASAFTPWWRQFPSSIAFSLAFDPSGGRAYVTSQHTVEPGTPYNVYQVVDTRALSAVVSVDVMLGPRVDPGRFVVASRPPPPLFLQSTVGGATVQLSWASGGPPAAVTRYVLEAGSAPGLNDIIAGLDVGLQTSFSATGVPSGRYYVRVRAGNYTGLSAPSNEVVVNTP